MRKRLLALGLAVTAGIGASSPGGLAARNASASPAQPIDNRSADAGNPASGVSGSAIVQYAMKYLGYPYTATGNSPSTGFSCIGFVSYVYRSLGIDLPGDLGGAMAFAPQVSFSQLQPGDVLYFQNTVWAGLSHAAIYIGGGRFVHAEWYNRGVVTSSFTNDPVDGNYWADHYLGANRPWTSAVAVLPTPSIDQSAPTPTPTPVLSPPTPTPIPHRHRTGPQRPSRPTAVVRAPALNVRSSPSLRATIKTVVNRTTRVVVLGRRYGWYRVALPGGLTGWVVGAGIAKRYAAGRTGRVLPGRAGVGRTALGASARVAVQRRTVVRRARSGGTVTVQVNGLRVHTAPSLGAAVLGSAGRGQRLAVVRSAGAWFGVLLPNGRLGWISRLFARVPGNKSVLQPASRRAAARSAAPQSRAKAAINLRAGASLSSAIIAVVAPGGAYRILGWSNGWARVRLSDGTAGWMSGAVLATYGTPARAVTRRSAGVKATRLKSATVASTTQVTARSVVTAGVRLHQSPGLSSPAIGLLAPGTHVQVLGSSAGWTKVRLSSRQTGYVLGLYVRQ